MSAGRAWVVTLLAGGWLLAGAPVSYSADPAAAERQYRIARRLAAEGSSEARAALEKVIELDPEGSLADDALVDQARLESPPDWPELTGWLDAAAVSRALRWLDDAVRRFPGSDRVHEALYLRALLRLEPLGTYDPSAAIVDLTAVSALESPWSMRARFARAWLLELEGDDERAFNAYQRLFLDVPDDPVGVRARIALARLLLRRGDYGPAAWRLQEAIEAGVPEAMGAVALRELAVRLLWRAAGAADPSRPVRVRTGVRGLAGFVPTASGGVLLGDHRQALVIEFDAGGARVGEWALEDVHTVTVDPRGRRFAAAGETLYRLDGARDATPVAALGDYAPVGWLAADAAGGFWLLERRGRRVGRIEPGRTEPGPWWEVDGGRLLALVWDGRTLVAVDGKQRVVVALDRNAGPRVLTGRDAARPSALAVDAAGRVAVLDGRTGVVRFVSAGGRREAQGFASPEVPRPIAVGLGPAGELHLFDPNGDWIVFR